MSKTNYFCIVRNEKGGCDQQQGSPAQMENLYAKFNAWKEKFKDNIVDMGGKLGDGAVVTADGHTDGPFMEVKEIVGGYMIIAADSLEEAIVVVRESPGVAMPGSHVEVREMITS